MSNQSVTKRISALREEAASIYGKRTNNESGRVQVVRETQVLNLFSHKVAVDAVINNLKQLLRWLELKRIRI